MGNTIDYNSDGTTLTMTVSELNGTTTKLEVPLSGFGFLGRMNEERNIMFDFVIRIDRMFKHSLLSHNHLR